MKKIAMSLAEIILTLMIIAFVLTVVSNQIDIQESYKSLYKIAYKIMKTGTGEVVANKVSKVLDATYCSDFAINVNAPVSDCVSSISYSGSKATSENPSIIMGNGMRLYGMESAFTSGSKIVTVDVSGTRPPGMIDKDILHFKVYTDGRVEPVGTKEQQYLSCDLTLHRYDAADKAAIKSALIAQASMTDAEAELFLSPGASDPKLPNIFIENVSYYNIENYVMPAFASTSAEISRFCN